MVKEADVVYEADYAVIGSGCCGIVSAVRAADLGLKVIVIEAYKQAGGSMFGTEGHYYLNGREIAKAGLDAFSEHDAFIQHMEFNNYRCDGRLTSAFLQGHGKAIDWILDQGVVMDRVMPGQGGIGESGGVTGIMFKGKTATAFGVLKKRAEELGVQIILKTRAKELVKEDGKIAGVIAENADGQTVLVKAPAVLIATGGFSHNDEMVAKYIKADADGMRHVELIGIQQGDGINMAWAAGAAEKGIRFLNGSTGCVDGYHFDTKIDRVSVQPFLWVNKNAKRFCDEMPPEQHFEFAMTAEQPGAVYWCILDSAAARRMETEKTLRWSKMLPRNNDPVEGTVEALEEAAAKGGIVKADTIAELAEKCDLDPEVLQKTFDDYNKACDDGFDPWFFKAPEALKALREPPYYAMLVHGFRLCTLGGIKINENIEVVDKNDKAIPGLYAGGNDAGGFYGNDYNYYDSGSCSSFAFFTGWSAANHVKEYLGK